MRQDRRVVIDGPLQRHLAGALRLRVDEPLTLVDGAMRLHGRVIAVDRRELVVAVERVEALPAEPFGLTLAIGLPKGKKLEEIVRHAVELGVGRVLPIVTERSVARGRDGGDRGARMDLIALEAAQQSGRAHVPRVEPPEPLATFAAKAPAGCGVVLWERAEGPSLLDVLTDRHEDCIQPGRRDATLVIGPEGGLAEREVAMLAASGYRVATLGPFTLRTETACLAALAVAAQALSRVDRP